MAEIRTETMTVNMGPQHPSTHGVLRLVLELDGEVIQSVMPTIGYLHTGIEKTAEQKKWQQVIPLVERMDYLAAQSNSLAYALGVEKLLGLEMPQRVKDIRVLIAELQRLASHLIWLGTHAMEIGAVSMLFYAIRERELLLNINELIAGFRFFPSYIRIGGLREDLPRGFHEAVNAFLDRFPGEDRRVRGAADEERHLPPAHRRRRRHLAGGRLRSGAWSGRSRAPPDPTTTCASTSRTAATRPTTSRCRRRPRATSTRATACASPRCARASRSARQAIAAHHADRRVGLRRHARRAAAEGQGLHRDGSADSALPDLLAGLHGAGRRRLRADRRAARRARLLRRVRRHQPAVAREDAARRRSWRSRRCRRSSRAA